ncbi:MAG: MoxR family ATPase [Cellvibrionaceae bacterium]|nr:MoxR family ATPase [Cellvibrionaceae bacterium]
MSSRAENRDEVLKQDIKKLANAENLTQKLRPIGTWGKGVHRFDAKQINALIAALASKRPLLVRGEPGVGKSQLAHAAAELLQRGFVPYVVQPDSEYSDLLWSVDYTRRLSDAQLAANDAEAATKVKQLENYIGPGPLWWAFNWADAETHNSKCSHNYCPPQDPEGPNPKEEGIVLLIDEIDKADISLANGLLEVLGNKAFAIPPLDKTLCPEGKAPLVVLTSNDIRELPAALLRRCVVLELTLPDKLAEHFIAIGEQHFPTMDKEVLQLVVEQILQDRNNCREFPKTGLAEFIDLLGALSQVANTKEGQISWLNKLGLYFHKSHALPR